MLTTNQKGAIAEASIAKEALRLGIGVYRSYGDERCDLIFDLHPGLVRVQCKWARRIGDVIMARLCSARRTATGLTRRKYYANEIDAYALYCPDTDRCYYLEIDSFGGRNAASLRLDPTHNNQAKGVNWACDYEFGATLGRAPGP